MSSDSLELVSTFHIKWSIFDPFSTWQNIRHHFYLAQPCLTLWFIELKPLTRIFKSRNFLCSLQYDNTMESDISVESVEISVALNYVQVTENDMYYGPFTEETGYLLNFEVEIADYDESKDNNLVIMMVFKIKRKGINAASALRNGAEMPLLRENKTTNMEKLVIDLRIIALYGDFSPLKMYSRENMKSKGHHFILQVRWNNLFQLHRLNEHSDFVNTNISYRVQETIVSYMYSAAVNTKSFSMWSVPAYAAEFFQVLYKYEIFHMYEALFQSHERITLRNLNYSDKKRIHILLNYVKNKHLTHHSYSFTIYVCPYANYPSRSVPNFLFTVHMKQEKLAGSWLSYSVLSRTEIPFNIHVNLEMQGNGGHAKCIHWNDYDIPGKERIVSGPILFLGCPETFYSHFQDKISKKLFFSLTFHHRTSSISIWSLSNPVETKGQLLDILSQHMSSILYRKFKADLIVKTRGSADSTELEFPIHKAIFDVRLFDWREVVEPRMPACSTLPDSVKIPISKESFSIVAFHMYTGRRLKVPGPLKGEILAFASNSGFRSLAEGI